MPVYIPEPRLGRRYLRCQLGPQALGLPLPCHELGARRSELRLALSQRRRLQHVLVMAY